MDIMVGVENSIQEKDIEKLAGAGATEFFCGIMPAEWVSLYNYAISLNKREWKEHQFKSFEKLAEITRKIHQLKKKIAVAFNAHYYTKEQFPMVEKYLRSLEEINIDALIVGTIPLLLLIRNMKLEIDVYVSGEAAAYSSRAVGFFRKYGVKRIMFPRDLSIAEMSRIINNNAVGGLEYEAFAMSERCVTSSGYCRTTHGYSTVNFCSHNWKKGLYAKLPADFLERPVTGNDAGKTASISAPSLADVRKWNYNTAQFRSFSDCSFFPTTKREFACWGGCGLCAVNQLKEIGVTSLKIVSRSSSCESKIARLKMIKEVLNGVEPGLPIKIKNTGELCESGYACYYRNARARENLWT